MPNNIDMSGFGSAGLPVRSSLLGGVVLDTPNTATARLFDLKVGGSSKMWVTNLGSVVALSLIPANESSAVVTYTSGTGWDIGRNGIGTRITCEGSLPGITIASTGCFGFSSTTGYAGAKDLYLYRDAASELAQRNGTTAQTFRVYDTYTDASNYGRLALNTNLTGDWVQVAAETAGTGGDNYGIALSPTGTGAISAHVPDSGTAGGNARGANAVDWQTTRGAATAVASGATSTVSGGIGNRASATSSTVVGGINNNSTGSYSVSGGYTNTASDQGTVALGYQANASAFGSVAIGYQVTASGVTSTALGAINTASGAGSWIPGGSQATTRGITGAGVYANGQRAALGDRQTMVLPIACAARTDATATVMTSDAGAGSTANQMVLPNNSSMFFEVDVVAHDSSLKSASWKVQGTIRRGANAAATAIVGTNVTTTFGSDLSGGSPGVTCTADTTNGALAVTFTGIAATTIYPSGHIRTVIAA